MSSGKKSIDGLTTRPQKVRQIAVTDAKKRKKLTPEELAKLRAKQKKREKQAHNDFLKPVGTFDMDSDEIKKDLKKAPKKDRKGKKAKKPTSKKRKVVRIILLVIVLLLVAAGIWIHYLISTMTNGNSGLWDTIGAVFSDGAELKKDENGRTNILVFGTSGYEMGGSGHDGAQLTDSIMLVSLDEENNDIAMTSIPRDLKVKMACSAGKINEVYWCHNQTGKSEVAGAEALAKQVEEVLGQTIQYRAHLDWGALVQLVDALGGITVTLDEDINDSWTKTYIKAGQPKTLNGEQALGLARARHGTTGGDFTRGNSQQKILMAIAQKASEKGLDLSAILSMITSLGDNLRMDFTTDEIKTLYRIGTDFDLANIRQVPLVDSNAGVELLTTGNINGISYVLPKAGNGRFDEIHKYMKRMLSSDPVVREGAEILVLNGSETAGVASTEQKKLEKAGFTVGKIGDAPKGNYEGNQVYVLNEQMTGTKAKLADYYKVEVQDASQLPRGVSKNYDFVVIVVADEGN